MNERQRRFCEHYATTGSAAEAARLAGYSERTARSQGQRLLTNDDIVKYIRELQDEFAAVRIATMTQTKAFWTTIMNNAEEKTADRLKASELLARAAGAFLHFQPDTDGGGIVAVGEMGDGSSDVVMYVPQMLSEEACQWKEGEDGHGNNDPMG